MIWHKEEFLTWYKGDKRKKRVELEKVGRKEKENESEERKGMGADSSCHWRLWFCPKLVSKEGYFKIFDMCSLIGLKLIFKVVWDWILTDVGGFQRVGKFRIGWPPDEGRTTDEATQGQRGQAHTETSRVLLSVRKMRRTWLGLANADR